MLLTRLPLYKPPCGGLRVRLACVRHAASVDSEPGSNSHVKGVAAGYPRLRGLANDERFNAEQPVENGSLYVVQLCQVIGGSQLAVLTITDGQSTNSAAPPADTRRVVLARSI